MDLRCRGLWIWGVRTVWQTEGDGEFFCPRCGGDRNYSRRTGTRRLTVFNIPVLHRGSAGTVVECGVCQERFALDALDQPTSSRFAAMLRDAVHTVALAVLTAGGATSRHARQAALEAVRAAGFTDCTEDQLIGLLAALAADEGRLPGSDEPLPGAVDGCGTWLSIELHEALGPLTPHLAPQGRERILLQGARIALADGPYRPAEREALAAVGRALLLPDEDTARLLEAAARTPS
ncbi:MULTISPECIES: TerB family tellurite resistance protein [Streptomycetaceae]|uniref:TerB family tellurite resistance protein n=1 Tax=Streptomyces sp. SID5468 TaxID=2690295 RepID=UPI001E538A47|nr:MULTISPECIES: TerB family tellurite resistance protein [Streptomycetaceae]